MLKIKISPTQKMIIDIDGEKVEISSEKNIILGILANKEKVSIHREKLFIASEDTVSNPQEKD